MIKNDLQSILLLGMQTVKFYLVIYFNGKKNIKQCKLLFLFHCSNMKLFPHNIFYHNYTVR